jgi:hypothetical protein
MVANLVLNRKIVRLTTSRRKVRYKNPERRDEASGR